MIEYKVTNDLDTDVAYELYVASTLGERRPIDDRARFETMLRSANLTITAWDGELLVGISRSITDWVWFTYLSDLAVRVSHQRQGIGVELMRRTQAAAPQASVLLLAAPKAKDYYGRVGYTNATNAWILRPAENVRTAVPRSASGSSEFLGETNAGHAEELRGTEEPRGTA